MRRSRLALWPWLLLIGTSELACTGTETGNPTKGRASFSLESSDHQHFPITGSGGGVHVENVIIGVQQLTFTQCQTQSVMSVAEAKSVDLRDGKDVFEVPEQRICNVELRLEARDIGWADVHSGSDRDLSLGIAGLTTMGAPLFVEDDATPPVVFHPAPFEVTPETQLVISLDIAKALSFDEVEQAVPDPNGEVIVDGQVNGSILANIQQRWATSWSLYTVNESGGLDLVASGEAQ